MSCGPGLSAGAAAFFSAHEPILSSLVIAICASSVDVRVVAAVDWDQLAQAVVNALTLGSIYALIALGYSMVYGILKLLNFAHGDVFMIGAFVGLGILHLFGGAADPSISIWLVLVLMVGAAMVVCPIVGVGIERFAYRPLRTAPRIAPLISALGVSFFLQYSIQLLFGAEHRTYDTFLMAGGRMFESAIRWGPLDISLLRLVIFVVTILLMGALWLLVARTRVGKAMRATSFDREAAAMMGIDIDRVVMVTFVLGSSLAGAGGVLFALRADVFPQMGFLVGLAGFVAAVIGGIGSVPGAMLGGYLLGLIETVTQTYITTEWSNLVIFAILVVVMLVRPQGLLGKAEIRKV
jgi:branched-chain amino acid transport system permease protein